MSAMTTCVVVLDRRTDKNASTGLFELAYRQPPVAVPSYVGISLLIEGQVIKKPSGESKKTSNDGGSHCSRDENSQQNKVRCVDNVEEPGCSTHKMKPVDAGAVGSMQRAAQNRSSQAKPVSSTSTTTSIADGRTRHKLTYAVAVDSALTAVQERLDGCVRAAEGIKDRRVDQQKCTTTVVGRQRITRNREPCKSESSDSESEPHRPRLKMKTTKTVKSWVHKTSTVDRRRSRVPASESAVSLQPPTTTTTSGWKRRKATRPGAAKPRRRRRSKVGVEADRRRHAAVSDVDSDESASSDHGHSPSTPPPSDSSWTVVGHPASSSSTNTRPLPGFGRAQRIPSASKATRTRPAAATCNVMLTTPVTLVASTSRPSRSCRRLSFQEFTHSEASTIRPSASVAVHRNSLSRAAVSSLSYAGPPRLTTDTVRPRTLLPNTSSLQARQVGVGKRIVLPIDCSLRHGPDAAASLQFVSPASRSLLMRGRDFSDLQASMQVIGLGNAA